MGKKKGLQPSVYRHGKVHAHSAWGAKMERGIYPKEKEVKGRGSKNHTALL